MLPDFVGLVATSSVPPPPNAWTRLENGDSGTAAASDKQSSRPRVHFHHLDGVRSLAALWVVLEHYASTMRASDGEDSSITYAGGYLSSLFMHGNTPVSYFVVLSGFVTSYANGSRDLGPSQRADFLVKRFARVGLSYYCAALLGLACSQLLDPTSAAKFRDNFGFTALLELFMAHSTCILFGRLNSTSWTVSMLACCWLLYPSIQLRLRNARAVTLACVALASTLILWTSAIISLWSCVDGHEAFVWSPEAMWSVWKPEEPAGYCVLDSYLHMSPVMRLPEFLLGVACGQLLATSVDAALPSRSIVSWTGSIAIVAVPLISGIDWQDCARFGGSAVDEAACAHRSRQVFYSCLAPLFALYMYCSCLAAAPTAMDSPMAENGHGPLHNYFSSKVLVGLGKVSFQVYIFQEPLHTLWSFLYSRSAGDPQLVFQPGRGEQPYFALYTIGFVVSLWTFAAMFAEYVETPAMRRVEAWQKSIPVGDRAARDNSINWWSGVAAMALWSLAILVSLGSVMSMVWAKLEHAGGVVLAGHVVVNLPRTNKP
jgi:peptidoglycan/LPS O-acetylase OafA/YrhL